MAVAAPMVAMILAVVHPSTSLAAASATPGAMTAIVANPCPPRPTNDVPSSTITRTLLQPGAQFSFPSQTAQQKTQAARAAAEQRALDWANLCHYQAANGALKKHPRVVFMGDSITELWLEGDPTLFNDDVVDRGISGQTSAQMLLRFWPDVIALHPSVVHILAGTNDIAGNTGPTTEHAYEDNIKAMVELAQAHHIRVVLGSIPPTARFWWAPQYRPAAEVRRLNGWLRRYARARGARFVDYYAGLAAPDGAFRRDFSNDGVHPNFAGFKIMSALARAAIESRPAAPSTGAGASKASRPVVSPCSKASRSPCPG